MADTNFTKILNEDPRGLSSDGLTLATFTTSAPVFPTFIVPKNFLRSRRLIHIRARGIWAATATPTYTFRLQSTVGTVVTVVTTAAITVSALTNQSWEIDIQIRCDTEAVAGKVTAMGDLNMGGVAGGPIYLPATGTAPSQATIDTTIDQTWGLEIACSASSASNTVKGIILEAKSIN